MRKAEEEAIRRARRKVVRLKKGAEDGGMGVLDELFGGEMGGVEGGGLGGIESDVDDEDEDMSE